MRGNRVDRFAIAAVIACAACAPTMQVAAPDTEEPERPPRFPTASDLEKLSTVPIQPAAQPRQTHEVESWTLSGPFDADLNAKPHPEATGAQKLLLEVSARARVETSASMACVAREVGSFFLQHEKYPAPALEAFMAGRCGAPVMSVGVYTFGSGEVAAKQKESDLFGFWKEDLEKLYVKAQKPDHAYGVWFGRKGKTAMFFLASGPKKSELTEISTSTATPERFVVRGKLLVEGVTLRALVNRGAFGVAPCELNERVALPAFDVTCTGDPKDSTAWIEIVALPPGRILGPAVARVLISPSGAPSNTYSRSKYSLNLPVDGAEAIQAHLVTAINRVRQDAGLKTVDFEAEQSATAGKVAQHYFAATSGKVDATIADVVVLGVRAGWNVNGMVRYGLFTAAASGFGGNVDDLLGSALERPFGREVLLDPEVRKVAIGSVWQPEEKYFGAIISTYAMFEETPQSELVKEVYAALREARAKAGFGPAGVLAPFDEVGQKLAAAIEADQIKPRAALQNFIQIAANALPGRMIGGWVLESDAIEKAPYPPELVKQPGLKINVAVARHRTRNDPWGRYVVLIIFETPPPITTTMVWR